MSKRDLPEAYPLQWPVGQPRTSGLNRQSASFGKVVRHEHWTDREQLTVVDATRRLLGELDRLGAGYPVMTSNLKVKNDGLPYSKQRPPDDPGVAVYFMLADETVCLPCDRWDRIADNIAAVAKHVEAIRGMERWGVGTTKQAFAGYAQKLPAPGSDWRAVFGYGSDLTPPLELVKKHYREMMMTAHPDKGGDQLQAPRINDALAAAEAELGR